ncbi:MAG: hypothetical protein GC145_13605 [Caulobacter sp.]|nr:hypothetical protein [Caulobacter sp.]
MTLATSTPDLKDATEKATRLPVGVSSPLWMMIGGAAMMGAAVFWATRWMRPTNLEALLAAPRAAADDQVEAPDVVETAAAVIEATADAVVETMTEAVGTVVEALPDMDVVMDPVIEAPVLVAVDPDPLPAPEAPAAADDLTVLKGVGPKLAAALAERGVTRLAQIAAWTEAEVEALDKDMKLMGRIGREAWIEQARSFSAA